MTEVGLRRHSSCSSSLHFSVPSRTEDSKRLHRASSIGGDQAGALQKLQENVATRSYDGYCITAEAPRPENPEHKIIIMEKCPEPDSKIIVTEKCSDTEQNIIDMEKLSNTNNDDREEEGGDNYIQIRSPTSREKISIMAVIDRCRAYQESDEYKQREGQIAKLQESELKPRPISGLKVNSEQKTNSGLKVDLEQKDSGLKVNAEQRNSGLKVSLEQKSISELKVESEKKNSGLKVNSEQKSNSGPKVDVGQQSIVKNLREKFQSLS